MCKAPSPPKPKEPKKPQFLRNQYLDEFVGDFAAVKSLKSGRSSLRIPAGSPAIAGRQPGEALGQPPAQTGLTGPEPLNPNSNDAERQRIIKALRGRIFGK
jgi:hypothetical protein